VLDVVTGAATPLLDNWQGQPFNSPNDVCVGADGSVWFTDPDAGAMQARALPSSFPFRMPQGAPRAASSCDYTVPEWTFGSATRPRAPCGPGSARLALSHAAHRTCPALSCE
jgi:sugar lactone lactonase YvrE